MRQLKTKWIMLAGIAMLASACHSQDANLAGDGGLPFADPAAGDDGGNSAAAPAFPAAPPTAAAPTATAPTAAAPIVTARALRARAPAAAAPAPATPTILPAAAEPEIEAPVAPSQPGPAVAPALFTDALAPYGSWTSLPCYGRVWVPSVRVVGTHFRSYGSQGRWVFTDGAWNWVSSFSWGWAPFH